MVPHCPKNIGDLMTCYLHFRRMAPAPCGVCRQFRADQGRRARISVASSPRIRIARFRQINVKHATSHHDALEFPDGQVVLLTRLCEGQRATVLQLPAVARPAAAKEPMKREVREPWPL